MTETQTSNALQPVIFPPAEHGVSRSEISRNALKVLYRLKDAGYSAFLVGGGVRDLLLGLHPKDFDIATNARPEEVRALFSNSRLIGRRFRLAHVRFGRDIIEVATFRGTGRQANGDAQEFNDSGRIISDNVFGSLEEDALRRDFTVNALYYDVADDSIWDFAGGLDDLKHATLRVIGDPSRRFTEDPVRMLRAARLAAKLNFNVYSEDAAAIPPLTGKIADVPPARLFDEFLKIFQGGHALAGYRLLRELGLFDYLFPVRNDLPGEVRDRDFALLEAALENTDQRIADGKPVTPMFLFGVFLWTPVRLRSEDLIEREGMSLSQSLAMAAGELSREQSRRIALPRRFSFPMKEILQLQARFANRRGRRAIGLLQHRRFRAAYDLMMLRVRVGEVEAEVGEFWTEVQTLDEKEQRKAFAMNSRRRGRSGRPRRGVSPA